MDSSLLPWRIPWTEEPGGLYSPWGRVAESDMTATEKQLLLREYSKEIQLLYLIGDTAR